MKVKELFETIADIASVEKVVATWKNVANIGKVEVLPNGSIDIVSGPLMIRDGMLVDGKLPIKIRRCDNAVQIYAKIVSCENFPDVINNETPFCSFQSMVSQDITSLGNWVFTSFEGVINLRNFPKLSLSKINTNITHCAGSITINDEYVGPILGVLKIRSLKMITCAEDSGLGTDLDNVLEIVSKYLKGGKSIFDCQEELIKNGYKRYARL